MGTSSRYKGLPNNPAPNPLLPSDFIENENLPTELDGKENEVEGDDLENEIENEGEDIEQSSEMNSSVVANWSAAKNFMSRFASGSSKNKNGAISKYVKAHGSSRKASKSAISGTSTALALGGFLKNSVEVGVQDSLLKFKIDSNGKTTEEIFVELINFLSPAPVTKEDSAARKALILTMQKLYEVFEEEDIDFTTIDKLSPDVINIIIPFNISTYIFQRLLNDLGNCIEENAINSEKAIEIESELQEYVESKVSTVFRGKNLAEFEFTKANIESLFNQCYTIMEEML